MKRILILLALGLFVFQPVAAQKKSKKPADNPAGQIQLEDIWLKFAYYGDSPDEFDWMKDDRYYALMEGTSIAKYAIDDEKKVETILDLSVLTFPEGIKAENIQSYTFSEDENTLLLTAKREAIYRRSSKVVAMVWDSRKAKLHLLHEGKKVSNPALSPDGKKVGYVFENNIYLYDLSTGETKAVTTDGKMNEIINGACDWVYEEEFEFAQAWSWSPDGKYIGYYRFDERAVPEFQMAMYGSLYPTYKTFKYPKAGEANSVVSVFIYDVNDHQVVPCEIGAEKDQYIPRIRWTNEAGKLAIMRMNRLQNNLDVLLADGESGKTQVILNEVNEKYIEVKDDKWVFLENSSDFLWQSEKSGFNHVYRYNLKGELQKQLTAGNWEVTGIMATDEKNAKLFYMSKQASVLENHLYAISLTDGGAAQQITKEKGVHEIGFSKSNSYYIDTYSAAGQPPVSNLYKANGEVLKKLVDNAELNEKLAKLDIQKPEFFTFKTSEGIELNAWMIKPKNFNPKKKYPVWMTFYGGPGSQEVLQQWDGFNYMWHQMLAQKGYIVVCADNRGTGGRGETFKKITYKQLGKYECIDQIETAKYLGKLPYVDASRIGLWGWSFGGYLTSLCLVKGGEYFKAGIAVAPVTNWRFYDTIYTERYLQTPQLNAEGYDANSPINFAKDLKSKYLVIHGSADDNVHYQNTMEWTDALVKANRQFDMMIYPNKNHSIYGGVTRFQLYQKMTNYILGNL